VKLSQFSLLVISLLFILSPVIFFPPSETLNIYLQEGQALFQGNSPSTENLSELSILSTALYGALGFIAGSNLFIFRTLECIIHLLTSIALFFFIKKYFSKSTAVLSSIVYAMSIVLLNYKFSFQIEPLANILLLALMALHMNNSDAFIQSGREANSNWNHLIGFALEGIILGIMISLKSGFGIMIIGIFAFDIIHLQKSWKILSKQYAAIFFGIVLFIGSHIILLNIIGYPHILANIFPIYNLPHISFAFIRDFLKDFAKFSTNTYSIFFVIALCFSLINWINNIDVAAHNSISNRQSNLFAIAFYFAMSIILGFGLTQHFEMYHFASLFIPFSIFIANGLELIFKKSINLWRSSSIYYRGVILICAIFLLAFSPIFFWVYYMQYPFIYLIFSNYAVLL